MTDSYLRLPFLATHSFSMVIPFQKAAPAPMRRFSLADGGGVDLFTTIEPETIIEFFSPDLPNSSFTKSIGPIVGTAITNPNGFTSGSIVPFPDGGGLALQAFTDATFTATLVPEPSLRIYSYLCLSIVLVLLFSRGFAKHRKPALGVPEKAADNAK